MTTFCAHHGDDTWFDRTVCPEPCGFMHTRCVECGEALDGLCADIASCPGFEAEPNLCRCPCYGCKHHCSAHDPTDIEAS